jgi:hypothetical protein
MALLRRVLHRRVRGLEVPHADRCTLVFDTDTKILVCRREVAHLDACVDGAIEMQTATMDITDYLSKAAKQLGTANCGGY